MDTLHSDKIEFRSCHSLRELDGLVYEIVFGAGWISFASGKQPKRWLYSPRMFATIRQGTKGNGLQRLATGKESLAGNWDSMTPKFTTWKGLKLLIDNLEQQGFTLLMGGASKRLIGHLPAGSCVAQVSRLPVSAKDHETWMAYWVGPFTTAIPIAACLAALKLKQVNVNLVLDGNGTVDPP